MKIIEEVKISDNGFVFNSKTGDSFNINPVGLTLIKLISQDQDFATVKKTFLEKYDVDDLTFEKDYYEFCSLLKNHQLTVQDDPLSFK